MKIENGFGPIDIAISGLRAQNKQMEIVTYGHYGFPLRLGVPAEQSVLRVHAGNG